MKQYRALDFIFLLLSVDAVQLVFVLVITFIVGEEEAASALKTATYILYPVLFWIRLGIAVLFIKKVPFRTQAPDASLAFKKIWKMAFFWPMLLKV